MALEGSSIKTCYIRGGSYHNMSTVNVPNGTTGTGFTTFFGGSKQQTVNVYLTSADNGEMWSYYPSDGYNSAVFDGGSSSNTTGTFWLIYMEGASGVTINGLYGQNYLWGCFAAHSGTQSSTPGNINPAYPNSSADIANGPNIINNICHDTHGSPIDFNWGNPTGAPISVQDYVPNTVISHNAVWNAWNVGIMLSTNTDIGGQQVGNYSNSTINNNYVRNVGLMANSCGGCPGGNPYGDYGGIYLQSYSQYSGGTASTNINITDNYVNQIASQYPSNTGSGGPVGIYLDDGTSNVTETGNVVVTEGMTEPQQLKCFFIHGGSGNTITGNICDIASGSHENAIFYFQNSPACTNSSTCMQNNVVAHNILSTNGWVGNPSIYCGSGCPAGYNTPNVHNNAYWETGSQPGSAPPDSAPTLAVDPAFTCWSFNLPSGGAMMTGPTAFPAQPANWGQAGFWGPPGFALPHLGVTPSFGPSC